MYKAIKCQSATALLSCCAFGLAVTINHSGVMSVPLMILSALIIIGPLAVEMGKLADDDNLTTMAIPFGLVRMEDEKFQQPTVAPVELPVVLRACCGTNCVDFDNLHKMVGLQCCSTTAANFYEKICCGGRLYDRRNGQRYYDRCCADKPYSYEETCCKGQVFPTTAQSCCGPTPYNIYDRAQICCGEKLYTITNNTQTPACCSETLYDAYGGTQFCCGGKIYDRTAQNGCCVRYRATDKDPLVADGYKTDTQQCCDGVFNLTEFDACCYVSDTSSSFWKPPKPTPYNSKTSCCDLTGITVRNAAGSCV